MLNMPELEKELIEVIAATIKKKYPDMEMVRSNMNFNNTSQANGLMILSYFEFATKKRED